MARSSSRPTAGGPAAATAAASTSTSTTTTDDSGGGGLGPLFFLGVGLLLGVVGFVALLAREMDMFKPLPPPGFHPQGFACRVVGKEFVGVEDLVLVAGGQSSSSSSALPRVLLAGSDDRLRLWEHPSFGPGKTPDGALLALYDHGGEDIRIERLPLSGFPKDVAFHPHGLYFHKESHKLYVINHAYAKGGERIDVFKLALGKKDGKAAVTWKYAIAPLLFQAEAMGILNDLAVVDGGVDGQDELYVTHYRPFPDSIEGRLAPGNVLAKAHNRLTDLSMAIKGRWTRVLYCKGGACRPTEATEGIGAGKNGLAYNGINLSPDKRRLLVADTKFLHVFEILPPLAAENGDKHGGSRHRLKRVQLLRAPHLVDNIEAVKAASEGDEVYTLGSVGHIFQFLQHNQLYAQHESGDRDPSKLNITGGVQLLTRHQGTGRYSVKEVFIGDGSALSGVSAAVRLPPTQSSSSPERFLLGSWSDTGVLLCTRTQTGGGQQQQEQEL